MVGLGYKQVVINFFVMICFFITIPVYANLSVYEVIERIVSRSPELRILFEKRLQSENDYDSVLAAYLPNLSFSYERDYQKTNPLTDSSETAWEGINKIQLILEQRIFDLEQMSLISRYARGIQVIEYQNYKSLETLIYSAIIAYYEVIRSDYKVSLFKNYLAQNRTVDELIYRIRLEGDATSGDVNLVKAKLASAQSSLIIANTNLDKAKLRLAYLMDIIDKNDVTVDLETILPELITKDVFEIADRLLSIIPASRAELLERSLHNNVDILILRAGLCAADYDLENQKAKYFPTLILKGELRVEENFDNTTFSRYGKVGIAVRQSIYDGGSRSAGIKKSSSVLREIEYQYDILVRDTLDEAYSGLSLVRSLDQQRLSILREISAAEEVDRVYNLQFQYASRSLNDRLDNLERLNNARIKLIDLDLSILDARLRVLVLMGELVSFFGFHNYVETGSFTDC